MILTGATASNVIGLKWGNEMKKILLAGLLTFLFTAISGCGPIVGQLMRLSEGVKEFRVVEGDLSLLRDKKNLLVLGPFSISENAYYFSRGDDAAFMTAAMKEAKKFETTELYVGPKFRISNELTELKKKSPEVIKKELDLETAPDLLMYGTITERETIVAPARGIIMLLGYKLEFVDIDRKRNLVIEIKVKDHLKNVVETAANEIIKRTKEI